MITIILYLIVLLLLLVFLIFMSVYTISLIYSNLMGAPYVPTSKKVLDDILSYIKIEKNKNFYELGCGDARMTRYAVARYKVKGTGIDVNPLLIFWAKLLSKFQKINKNCEFKTADIMNINYSKADYLYIFLMPKLTEKILPKLKKELKKGTIIISHGFVIPKLKKNLFKTRKAKTFSTYYYRV